MRKIFTDADEMKEFVDGWRKEGGEPLLLALMHVHGCRSAGLLKASQCTCDAVFEVSLLRDVDEFAKLEAAAKKPS